MTGLFIDLYQRRCVILGGGKVAFRKAKVLLKEKAQVRIVAEKPQESLLSWAHNRKRLELIRTKANIEHIRDAFLVICATGNKRIDSELSQWAKTAGILSCCASEPSKGDVHFPALLRRGPLSVAVATAGISPGFSRKLRDHVARQLKPSLLTGIYWLARIREYCQTEIDSEGERRRILLDAAEEVARLLQDEPLGVVRERLAGLVPGIHLSYEIEEGNMHGEDC